MPDPIPTDVRWRTSSNQQGSTCVEVGSVGNVVYIRDSKDRSGPSMALTATAWNGLIAAIRTASHDFAEQPAEATAFDG